MTVIEASRGLFTFFGSNDVFSLEKDFSKIVTISEDIEVDKEIITLALKNYEAQDLIASLKNNIWVLKKPLAEYSQNIEISHATIAALVAIVNEFCENTDIEKDKVDPLNVIETDFQSLILIYHNLKNSVNELNNE